MDKIIISENVEPESVEVSLDEVERRAILGDDPERPPQGTIADKIHAQRLQVREGIIRTRLHEKATEQTNMSPWLAKQAAEAVGVAREHLAQLTRTAFETAMAQGQQLRAMRDEAIRDDRRLSDDGRETRRLRREQILDRLERLDDHQKLAAVETDDAVAEAVNMAPRWRLEGLGILPSSISEAGDRLFARRAPGAYDAWRRGREQLQALSFEVRQASKLAGVEVTEEDIAN